VLDAVFGEIGEPALGETLPDLTQENLQSRVRGAMIMAVSNRTGAIVLTTGNKSELAVGYCTLYGDMNGGLAVLSDVPKTRVFSLSRWMNEHWRSLGFTAPPIPENTITKPPSAELAPDQKDSDSLPDYEHARRDRGPACGAAAVARDDRGGDRVRARGRGPDLPADRPERVQAPADGDGAQGDGCRVRAGAAGADRSRLALNQFDQVSSTAPTSSLRLVTPC
jgi:hypothetical protein